MEPGSEPEIADVALRRYECQACGAVIAVGPAEMLTRKLYSGAAVAWALALYGLSLLSMAQVRERVSPLRVVETGATSRWRTLARWCSAASAGSLFTKLRPVAGSRRAIAAAAATALSAYAMPSPDPPSVAVLAFRGAAHAA